MNISKCNSSQALTSHTNTHKQQQALCVYHSTALSLSLAPPQHQCSFIHTRFMRLCVSCVCSAALSRITITASHFHLDEKLDDFGFGSVFVGTTFPVVGSPLTKSGRLFASLGGTKKGANVFSKRRAGVGASTVNFSHAIVSVSSVVPTTSSSTFAGSSAHSPVSSQSCGASSVNLTHRRSSAEMPAAIAMQRAMRPSSPEQGTGSSLTRESTKARVSPGRTPPCTAT